MWQTPRSPDIQAHTLPQQILPVTVIAEWDLSGRKPCYIVDNVEEIQQVFLDITIVKLHNLLFNNAL